MAIKATIYKLKLEVSNLDANYFQSHDLTIACHPSETEKRLMVRVLAFAVFASDSLSFTKGLCADDEPDLWDKNLSNDIELWISLGQVDKKQIKKALGRSKQVVIFTYSGGKSSTWWKQNRQELEKHSNLQIINVKPEDVDAMEQIASRNMDLQYTIQEGIIWLSNTEHTLNIELENCL